MRGVRPAIVDAAAVPERYRRTAKIAKEQEASKHPVSTTSPCAVGASPVVATEREGGNEGGKAIPLLHMVRAGAVDSDRDFFYCFKLSSYTTFSNLCTACFA